MMLSRLMITFEPDEIRALAEMCESDFRLPKEMVRWLLRQEAQRRGLLPANPPTTPVGGDEPREVQP